MDQHLADKLAKRTWQSDLLASLVVFLVALPLCMGIAIASGAPVGSGLITGIVGGLIVGLFSGAPLQVSGPAAGLTVICGEIVHDHGLAALGIVVLIAGGVQLVAGLLKFGQWFRAVSPAVVRGMLSGIGVLIVASQIHVMVDDRPRGNGLVNLMTIPEAIQKGLPIPVLEDRALREAQTELLQLVGQLHEEQSEVEAHLKRLLGAEEDGDELSEELEPHITSQKKIVEGFARARDKADAAVNGRATERANQIRAALATAGGALETAASDLVAGRAKSIFNSQRQASEALGGVLNSFKSHDWAAKLGFLSIAVIILWQGMAPKSLRAMPGPLLAVLIVTGVAWSLSLPVLYVEVPENIAGAIDFPSLNVLADVSLRDLVFSGVMMAVIASAETLLCATAVDRMHHGPRTNYDRELAAQGVGNLICGLLGGLPMTGVIVRSAANVHAGAHSRLSAILHGLWLLIFVAALAAVLRLIPTAALAGILVYTGFKLIDFKGFAHLCAYGRSEALIFLVTVVVIVVEDLLIGVITGVVLSAVKLLITFSRMDVKLVTLHPQNGDPSQRLRLSGAATFLRLPVLAAKLEEVARGSRVHVDLSELAYVDHACLELLMSWVEQHEAAGGQVTIDWLELHGRFDADRPPQTRGRQLVG
jgi:MFS superfamily sulfate permease-like transporter